MPRFTVRRIASSVGATLLALTLGAGLPAVPALADDSDPTTAPPGPAEPQVVEVLPDLRVTAAFDNPTYTSDQLLTVKVTVENVSTVAATDVRGDAYGDVSIHPSQWGELDPSDGPGGRLEPGQKVEVTLSGNVTDANVGVAKLHVTARTKGETNVADNHVDLTAQITATRGNYGGTVYGDRNNNGTMDPGEALNEVTVSGFGGVPSVWVEQTTGPDGRFSFRDIPTGEYSIYFIPPGGWVVSPSYRVTVDAVDDPDAVIRAVRPQSETLAASITFTQDSYAVGDTAHLTVTLTNRGPSALAGITAFCFVDGPGPAPDIPSHGPGWGDLADEGPGVSVPAGETRTFDVWHIVHEAAFTYGAISAFCFFGNPSTELGPADASAKARVPGGVGNAAGLLVYDRNNDYQYDGEGVANTKVILVDESTGTVVSRAITDTNGRYVFTNAPAGWHEFRVIGSWKLWEANQSFFQVLAAPGTADKQEILVIPGPNQPDPDALPTAPAAAPPTQQGGVAPAAQRGGGLASTGANVIGLSIAGLVMLVVGVGLVLIRRRRVW